MCIRDRQQAYDIHYEIAGGIDFQALYFEGFAYEINSSRQAPLVRGLFISNRLWAHMELVNVRSFHHFKTRSSCPRMTVSNSQNVNCLSLDQVIFLLIKLVKSDVL